MSFTLTPLPSQLRKPFMEQFDEFMKGSRPKWLCYVCKEHIYSKEEVTIHTRDVHGVTFGKEKEGGNDSKIKIKDVIRCKTKDGFQLSYSYTNYCIACGADSDEVKFMDGGLMKCCRCENLFSIDDTLKAIDIFWENQYD